jgi:hypothetical protein
LTPAPARDAIPYSCAYSPYEIGTPATLARTPGALTDPPFTVEEPVVVAVAAELAVAA